MTRRIGLSMRVTHATHYEERRDAIAQDWFVWVQEHFPELDIMLLPNLGQATPDYFRRWRLNGLILSGGNSIGQEPLRDSSELALLDMAKECGIPTLGVCRGMQLIQVWAGGSLTAIPQHVGRHTIRFLDHRFTTVNECVEVNSFHGQGIAQGGLAGDLEAIAVCVDDGSVEALAHSQYPMTAVMWHPERKPGCSLDPKIFRFALEL